MSPSLTRGGGSADPRAQSEQHGSPRISPSILGGAERANACPHDGFLLASSPAKASAPAPAGRGGAASTSRGGGASGRSGGRIPTVPPVPTAPPTASTDSSPPLLSAEAAVALDESYGADERALNDLLSLHPMCSMEATSYKTMQLVATMFEKASVQVADVPVIGKSYDDRYLRPPNSKIGERQCACDSQCLCRMIAQHRHGPDSNLAFVGTEFLLPKEEKAFLNGQGLPARRKKCLVCTRYYQTFLYSKARTDPSFRVTGAPISMQAFGNTVAAPAEGEAPDLTELGRSMQDLPISASPVLCNDGYKPEAMLFVDEEFAVSSRAAREGRAATLVWKPVVRFKTRHYRYVQGSGGPYMVQVGVGAADATGTGLGFAEPAAAGVAPLSA